jgi:hypothetical protein
MDSATDARLFTPPDAGTWQAGARATLHPQATVQVGEFTAQVDEELVPLITQLWRRGLWTEESCQDKDGYVFLAFLSLDEARRFCRAVLDWADAEGDQALAARVEWAGAPYDDSAPAPPGRPWKYCRLPYLDPEEDGFPNDIDGPLVLVEECVCVDFPRADLAAVLAAVTRFDGRKVVEQVARAELAHARVGE